MTQSLNAFMAHFREVFVKPAGDSSIGEQLYHLQQGNSSIDDYALHFHMLATATG